MPLDWELFADCRQVLAIGFLLVILSSALFHKYWPLLVVAIYVIAPLPNWICARCANPDDFMDSSSNSAMDFGRFFTGFLVLTGIGELPVSSTPFLRAVYILQLLSDGCERHCPFLHMSRFLPLESFAYIESLG